MLSFQDLESIKQLKARYFRYIDTKQWTRLRQQFTDDAQFSGLWATAEGPDAFVANVSANLSEGTFSAHYGFMPEIVEISDGKARGLWAMQDYLLWPADTKRYLGESVPGQRGIHGYGHYEEEYRPGADGAWLISSLRLTRLRIDPIITPEPPMPDYPFVTLSDGWIDG